MVLEFYQLVVLSKSLKFIDFLSILGGVPVLSRPIENPKDSMVFSKTN